MQWARWGRPECQRVDNGLPWGNWNDLPTPFALWAVGLGVAWHWNDPRCPQQNPKVERSQGTGKRWAEPGRCQTVAQLQAELDEADRIQREEYPTAGGGTRWELFGELRHSGRRYSRAWEERSWSLAAVEEHLAGYVAVRRVWKSGHVSVYHRGLYVGAQYATRQVQLQYDPQAHGWLISDEEGRELRRHAAAEISRAGIQEACRRNLRPEE